MVELTNDVRTTKIRCFIEGVPGAFGHVARSFLDRACFTEGGMELLGVGGSFRVR